VISIERVVVGYTIDASNGPERKAVMLGALRKHCRAERVDDLLDDLVMLVEDVEAARRPPQSLVREPR
jgi:hypothetical protein